MKRCDVDQAVFYRHQDGQLIIIVASVDDLTIIASTAALIDHVKAKLREAFTITDMGPIHWILGIQVTRDRTNRTSVARDSTRLRLVDESSRFLVESSRTNDS